MISAFCNAFFYENVKSMLRGALLLKQQWSINGATKMYHQFAGCCWSGSCLFLSWLTEVFGNWSSCHLLLDQWHSVIMVM